MINLTKFIMSDTKYLKINLECIHDDECKICANIDIDYVDEENNLCIRFGYCALSDFCYTISKSGKIQELIVGKRIYNKNSIDLGIECNQFFTGRQKKK